MSFRRHLVRWEAEYAACGLDVIEVSGGATATFDASGRRCAKWTLDHPVLWDRDNATAKAYGVTSWPYAVLIGADGRVFWAGNPGMIGRSGPDEEAFRAVLDGELRKAEAGGQ